MNSNAWHRLTGQLFNRSANSRSSRRNRRTSTTAAEALERRILLAAVTWTGAGDGVSWSDANNWDRAGLAEVPQSGDDVTIPNVGDPMVSGDVTILFSSGTIALGSLTSTESLSISGGDFRVGTASLIEGTLSLSGGRLTTNGDLTISRTFHWTGGRLIGAAATNLAAGAEMIINGHVLIDNTTVQGDGTVHWVGGRMSRAGYSGNQTPTFDVAAFNLIGPAVRWLDRVDLQNAGTMYVGGGGELRNYPVERGSLDNLAGGTLIVQSDFNLTQTETGFAILDNLGTVEVQSGSLIMNGHSTWYSGSTIEGPGYVVFDSWTASMGDGFTAENVRLLGGVVNAGNNWTVTGQFDLISGRLQGAAATNLAAGAEMVINGYVGIDDTTVQGDGTINWIGGTINTTAFGDSGTRTPTFDVAAFNLIGPAVRSLRKVHLQNAGTMYVGGGGGLQVAPTHVGSLSNLVGGTIIVQGDFNLPQGADLPFYNSGSIELQVGEINPTWVDLTAGSYLTSVAGSTLATAGSVTGPTQEAALFDAAGRLLLHGSAQTFEVMGEDRGATDAGYVQNFALGLLQLQTTTVTLADQSDNAAGTGAEALYVDALIVDAGSTLDLAGFQVYARTAQIDGSVVGGTVTVLNSTALQRNTPASGNIASAGEVDEWTFTGLTGERIALITDPGEGSLPLPVPPTLGQARIELLSPSDVVLATVESGAPNAIARLSGFVLPENGTYKVRIAAGSAAPGATGNYRLTVGDGTFDVTPLLFNTRELGLIELPYSLDHWTFSGSANQVVQLDVLESQASGIEFELTGPGGWTGFVHQTDDSPLIPLPADGQYVLAAKTDGRDVGAYTFRFNGLQAVPLTLGVGEPGLLTGSGDAHLYSVQITEANPLRIRFDDSSTSDNVEVYLKQGSAPTRRDFDYETTDVGADQTLIAPLAAPGERFVLVYGERVDSPSSFTIQADAQPAFLNTVAPSQGNVDATVVLTVNGTGFLPGSQVEIISPTASVIPAQSVSIDSFEQITATFDLTGASAGGYDVRVTLPDAQQLQLDDGFEVVPAGVGVLETDIILPSSLGVRAVATLYVEYANTGTAPLAAPVLTFQSADPDDSDRPRLTLDQSIVPRGVWADAVPDGFGESVRIYAQGSVPGLLLPGERISVPVYYAGLERPVDTSDTEMEFELLVRDADDTSPIDWTDYAATSRPDDIPSDAWAAVVANLTAQIGTTWGDYIRMLSETSAYLSQLGREVNDVDALFGYEFEQANGHPFVSELISASDVAVASPGFSLAYVRSFGASITQRYSSGPFGRGWQAPVQASLSVAGDGTVSVRHTADFVRRFEPDVRYPGQYLSPPGDAGRLEQLPGGEFELREPDGSFRRFLSDGKLSFVEDPNGSRITYAYVADQLTSMSHSSGESLAFTYNAAELIDSITDSAGWTVTYTYDPTNTLLESVTTPAGTTTYGYVTGQGAAREYALESVQDPSGVVQRFEYDALGRLTARYINAGVNRLDYTYDSAGRVTRTDASGTSSTAAWDELNRLARVEGFSGDYSRYEYDAAGNLRRIADASGAAQELIWSATGQLLTIRDELGNEIAFHPGGPHHQPLSFTDSNGNVTTYGYDPGGNRLSRTFADGTTEVFTYDAQGNVTTQTNRRNDFAERRYNLLGQMTRQIRTDGTTVDYEYDALNRLVTVDDDGAVTTYAYFPDNRLQRIDYPNSRWLEYDYDAAGRLTRLEDHTGHVVQYLYDAAGRLEQLQDAANVPIVTYAFDAAGRLQSEIKANGTTTTYTYDSVGNIESVLNEQADGTDNSRFDYTYDALGRRTGMTTLDGTWAYEYDATGQLIHAVFTSTGGAIPDQDLTYVYDAAGNRTEVIDNMASTLYAANNMNQTTSAGGTTFTYDDDGNLIRRETPTEVWTYAYDAQNQLTQVNGPSDVWEYEYDAFGNRTAAIENGVRTEFLLDPTGLVNVVGTYDASGTRVDSFVHGFGLEAVHSSVARHYFDFDALGSTSGLTDAAGSEVNSYAYTPFGKSLVSNETVANSFQYVGQAGVTNEDNGLHFVRARYYSTEFGVFLSQDPTRLEGGDTNLYRYAANNPITAIDPTGNSSVDVGSGASSAFCEFFGVFSSFCNLLFPPGDTGDVACGVKNGFNYNKRLDNIFDVGDKGVDPINPCAPSPRPSPPPGPGDGGGTNGGSGSTNTRHSRDPNEKLARGGFGVEGFITNEGLIPYTVRFENLGPGSDPVPTNPATAPAQRVVITDQLSAHLDWSTLRFTGFGFGDQFVTISEAGYHHFDTLVLTINGKTFNVDVELSFNSVIGELRAAFQSLDADTDLPPDVLTGFLPPEDGTGIGQGFISFTIEQLSGLPSGTEIRNVAEISFDGLAIIATNQVDPEDPSQGTDPAKEALVTIDAFGPSSQVSTLPAEVPSESFLVSWSGTDDAGGSGVAGYTVFVSTDGGPFEKWLASTTATEASYPGTFGHTYAFYSVARDNAGHDETPPPVADTQTASVASPPLLTSLGFNGSGNSNRSGLRELGFTFNQDSTVAAVTSLNLFNHTTGQPIDLTTATLLNNGSPVVSWDLSSVTLPEGRYTAELTSSDVVSVTGLPMTETMTIEFHILSGDLDGDGFVNFNDTVPISLNFGQTGAAFRPGDGDGDGIVNFNDTVPLSLNFGASLDPTSYDFGDAPETGTSFPTTLANNGARHVVTGNTLFFGADRDSEVDGQPDATATGDGADENGLTFDPFLRGTIVNVSVTSSGAGVVNGWIDFNQDGDWDDPGEHVLMDQPVVAGVNNLQVAVPSGASLGSTFARFRLTKYAGYAYFGLAPNGEVEDYQLSVIDPAPDLPAETIGDTATTAQDAASADGEPGSYASLVESARDPIPHRLIGIPAPGFATFDHPLSLFATEDESIVRTR